MYKKNHCLHPLESQNDTHYFFTTKLEQMINQQKQKRKMEILELQSKS